MTTSTVLPGIQETRQPKCSRDMTVGEAAALMRRPIFGDEKCIAAAKIVGMVGDLGFNGKTAKVQIQCEECEGEGDCPCCGDGSCPTCGGEGVLSRIFTVSDMTADEVSSAWKYWTTQQAAA